jgi:lysophospholipase L1-like esterase
LGHGALSVQPALRNAGFWLLLPLSMLQGLRLRSTARRLPEADGERRGETGQGERLRLLAIGDSIIAGVGAGTTGRSLPVQFARALADRFSIRVEWRIEGENGARLSSLRQRLAGFDAKPPADLVLISIGVNDVTGLSSQRRWRAQLEGLVKDLREKWPSVRVIFLGLPPMSKFPLPPQPLRFTLGLRAALLDAIASTVIARQPDMLHIATEIDPLRHGFCEDGFHPSAATCGIWAQEALGRLDDTFLNFG